MMYPITMPALSDTMTNGRLVKWLKAPGDPVKRGEVIAEVETDKAIMDVEAFHDGFLSGPLVAVDTELPIGQTIGYTADIPAQRPLTGRIRARAPPERPTSKTRSRLPALNLR
jgi:pyruvate dehydrogenase E2 component (dihydrolipoamide acetyltransferase)